jgi:hypothetical protein
MVSDLGVAITADLTTHSGGAAGTRSYMAPELVFGEKATRRSDIWSLGIVLHEVLFGCRPEWAMGRKGRRLITPAGAKGPLLTGLVRLCADCLVELPGGRPEDAGIVKRRFNDVVDGVARAPWRRRMLVLVPAVTLVVAGLVVGTGGRDSRSTDTLTGVALDLEKNSVKLLSTDRRITRCAQMLPGGRTLRLFLREPVEALDLHLADGRTAAANLLPDTFASGCPQVSPDGHRLLFEKQRSVGRPQVMLSDWPDGRDATIVTEGDGAFWLSSGDAFLYRMDVTRSAVFWLGRGPLMFPDTGGGVRQVSSHAPNSRGDEIAIVFATMFRT